MDPHSRGRGPGRGRAILLTLAGSVAVASGTVLAGAERIHPVAEWYALKLSRLGITAGPLLVCGAALLGLALVLGAIAKLNRRLNRDSAGNVALEQFAVDLKVLRESVARVHLELGNIQEAGRQMLELANQQALAPRAGGQNDDAVFRLAASLDQLWERVDKLLKAQASSLEQRLEGLNAHLDRGLGQVQGLVERGERDRREDTARVLAGIASAEARSAAPVRAPAAHAPARAAEPQAPEPPAALPDPPPALGLARDEESEQESEAEVDLGLLDDLDDFGELHPEDEGETPAAGQRPEAPRGKASPSLMPELDGAEAPEDGMQEKLDQLKSLLSETAYRKQVDLHQAGGGARPEPR